jgi:hypothetical protein
MYRWGHQRSLVTLHRPNWFRAAAHSVARPAVCTFQINEHNLERLLALASFLEVPQLLAACCAYMRHVLSTHTAVPLLVLAARYGCLDLKAELVSAIAVAGLVFTRAR